MSLEIKKNQTEYQLTCIQDFDRPRAEVFPFFADARNLERLTPSRLKFEVLTEDLTMKEGLLIDYKLKIRGFPTSWQSEISQWNPPHLFVDEQRRGPYKKWYHEHRFEELPDGGTRIIDQVDYQLPLGPLGRIAHALMVKRDLYNIFNYRVQKLESIFGKE